MAQRMTDRQPGWQQTAARISDRPHEREHALRWLARAARERGFAACRWLAGLALALSATAALAAGLPAAKEGDWTARDFRFRSGDVLPELRLHYTTVGDPGGIPVLVLHGTGGSGKGLLSAEFGEELFGPGQPLDAARYYVILPDSIGHGASTKPSDGLRTRFPRYNYDDMVEAQYRLVTEGMGIKHLRLVIGVSMGGMHTWIWGTRYPDFMDVLVPMSSQPTPMASRNWMLRRLITDTIRNDPEWNNGNYSTQPRSVAQSARDRDSWSVELKRVKNGPPCSGRFLPSDQTSRGDDVTSQQIARGCGSDELPAAARNGSRPRTP